MLAEATSSLLAFMATGGATVGAGAAGATGSGAGTGSASGSCWALEEHLDPCFLYTTVQVAFSVGMRNQLVVQHAKDDVVGSGQAAVPCQDGGRRYGRLQPATVGPTSAIWEPSCAKSDAVLDAVDASALAEVEVAALDCLFVDRNWRETTMMQP